MPVTYKDYYDILGVSRTASQESIHSAYRKLARKYHPDLNKAKDAEDKFKEIGEAYEVLRDPEKRRRYDQLGSAWRAGDEFTPPPGWQVHSDFSGPDSIFSDFFESLFGRGFQGVSGSGPEREQSGWRRRPHDVPGEDQEVRVRIPLEDTFTGAERTISLRVREGDGGGRDSPLRRTKTRSIQLRIPQGVTNGQRIRLAGQGGPGEGRAPQGDLYLIVEFEPHERFRVGGRDLFSDLPIVPWEAVLGTTVILPTPAGDVSLTVPPGTSSGQRLRLRGRGIPDPHGTPGDLYAEVRIVSPHGLSAAERAAWEKLARESRFNPRADW
ncbi:MAG: DnaJ domain-containing protein [Planctomycetota bacterium]|nr:DnaJ domain-containing protein [Planctomycetota bacterium]